MHGATVRSIDVSFSHLMTGMCIGLGSSLHLTCAARLSEALPNEYSSNLDASSSNSHLTKNALRSDTSTQSILRNLDGLHMLNIGLCKHLWAVWRGHCCIKSLITHLIMILLEKTLCDIVQKVCIFQAMCHGTKQGDGG